VRKLVAHVVAKAFDQNFAEIECDVRPKYFFQFWHSEQLIDVALLLRFIRVQCRCYDIVLLKNVANRGLNLGN
jgi:hypothetical protein